MRRLRDALVPIDRRALRGYRLSMAADRPPAARSAPIVRIGRIDWRTIGVGGLAGAVGAIIKGHRDDVPR